MLAAYTIRVDSILTILTIFTILDNSIVVVVVVIVAALEKPRVGQRRGARRDVRVGCDDIDATKKPELAPDARSDSKTRRGGICIYICIPVW